MKKLEFNGRCPSGVFVAAALGLSAVVVPLAHAKPDNTQVVINKIYGGGTTKKGPYDTDFVELYNPTNAPVSIDGWKLDLEAPHGTEKKKVVELKGTVAAKGFFLIRGAKVERTKGEDTEATGTMPSCTTAAAGAQAVDNLIIGSFDASVQLQTREGVVVDAVGFDLSKRSENAGGGGSLITPNNWNLPVMRKADGADTDNNGNDFHSNASMDAQYAPKCSQVAAQAPTPAPGPGPGEDEPGSSTSSTRAATTTVTATATATATATVTATATATATVPGAPGKDGTTPRIGDNGNWWIGDRDTGVQAGARQGTGAGAILPIVTAVIGSVLALGSIVFTYVSNAFPHLLPPHLRPQN